MRRFAVSAIVTVNPVEVKETTQRVLMSGISWATYKQLLQEAGDRRNYRLTYYQGVLEVTMPSREHESTTRKIDVFVRSLCRELRLNVATFGSTTLEQETTASSPEPDNCFYIQNEPVVRGRKTLDFNQDPPPDLVVEVDITRSSINKKVMYAEMGVPEFWRYDGKTQRVIFHHLQAGQYQEVETSRLFPFVQPTTLQMFLDRCDQDGELQAEDLFRAWVGQQVQQPAPEMPEQNPDLFQ